MRNKNEVFEYLIDQLRQQVNNNQCEDLAHEVLSLKNQLRDASALVAELQSELNIADNTVVRLRKEIAKLTGDVQGYIDVTEQSSCRKEDTQGCPHSFYYVVTDGSAPFGTKVCKTCGEYF